MNSGQQSAGTYPVPFTSAQMIDAFFNAKTYDFDVSAFQDPLDVNLDIIGAMAALNISQLSAMGIAIDPLVNTSRIFVKGTMRRREDGTCNGTKFVFNQNLCYFEINFGDVVRRQAGNTTQGVLYYPRITILFFASGYVFSNDVRLLYGAGTIIGGIDVQGSSGVITDLYVVSGTGPPIGTPSVFGPGIQIGERIDDINLTRIGNQIQATGITFGDLQSVSIAEVGTTFTVSSDLQTVMIDIPQDLVIPHIVTFRTSRDSFTVKKYFYP